MEERINGTYYCFLKVEILGVSPVLSREFHPGADRVSTGDVQPSRKSKSGVLSVVKEIRRAC